MGFYILLLKGTVQGRLSFYQLLLRLKDVSSLSLVSLTSEMLGSDRTVMGQATPQTPRL